MPAEPVVVKITVMSNGKIDRRREADPDVVLHAGDKVTWICPDADFMVYDVKRDCNHGALCGHHGDSPFGQSMPKPPQYVSAGGSITSPLVVDKAGGHVFKVTWATRKSIDGVEVRDELDPHIIVKVQ